MKTAVVVGASGYIGSACFEALRGKGFAVRAFPAPRLSTSARSVSGLAQQSVNHSSLLGRLAEAFKFVDVVVNAAGLATASADDSDGLVGANALLPGLLALTARQLGTFRLVHVSSASVQGRRSLLDESAAYAPFSPYSRSKVLGEQLVGLWGADEDVVILRPTSVHGTGRAVTRSLSRLAASPLSSTAAGNAKPSPQVLVQNVAEAVAYLALWNGESRLPRIVLQPSEGLTNVTVLELLGRRRPRRISVPLARSTLFSLWVASRHLRRIDPLARRIEMLWFGQDQTSGWLDKSGFRPPVGLEGWRGLGDSFRQRR